MYIIRYEQFTKCLHFSLEKKGKRIIHSLYWKFKDNIDLENQQKLSRQYYLQSKIYTKYILSSWSSWCILSNETSNTVLIDYCEWICFMNVCHIQYKPICEMAKENFFWLNENEHVAWAWSIRHDTRHTLGLQCFPMVCVLQG